MSQIEKDAAKRAAAGESLGAFVTLDINRLDKDELIMLGMREALSKYLRVIAHRVEKWDPSKPAQQIVIEQAMFPVVRMMREELDAVTLQLSQSALRHKTATLQEIPKEPT